MELLQKLGIDWRLFIAQLVNFAILLFVLNRFAYKPLLSFMEKRREQIAQGLKDAELAKKQRTTAEEEKRQLLADTHKQAQQIIEEAHKRAEVVLAQNVDETQKTVAKMLEEGKARLEHERVSMMREARTKIAELVVLASERLTSHAIDTDTHQDLIDTALNELDKEDL